MLICSQSLEESGNSDNVPQDLEQQGKEEQKCPRREQKSQGVGTSSLTHIKTKQN